MQDPTRFQKTGHISENSIAVLPFKNMSSDKENEYFSDGITEELINALTRVEGLSVIARSSAFTYKGQDIDPRKIGRDLGVTYILEGSVRKANDRVRVTAQLIKTSDCFHLFSEVYDRELKDIFEVQDDISNKIVRKFTDKTGLPETRRTLVTSSTQNTEAYELYLKGRFNLSKGSLEATRTAIVLFEAALQKDRGFVLPYAGLAACYNFLGGSGLMNDKEAFVKAREYASRTNQIDDGVAETHLSLAKVSFWGDWNFETTGIHIKKAVQLSPGTSDIHGFNALYLMASGKLEEALIEAQLAAKLDPLSVEGLFRLGELYYRSGRFVEAVEIFDEILSTHPFFNQATIFKAWSHLFLGDPESAANMFSNIPISTDESMTFHGGLAYAWYKLMKYDRILETLKNFKSEVEKGKKHWLNYNYALIFRALGEREKMFQYLEKGLKEKSTPVLFIKVDPVWDQFRSDPVFTSLVEYTFSPESGKKEVTIKSDTREEFAIDLNRLLFIEAQENYSRIVWRDEQGIREKLLRVTLKHLDDQLEDVHIVRCHRSYIINIKAGFEITGNSNGYRLKSKLIKDTVPISRSLGKEIVNRLRSSE